MTHLQSIPVNPNLSIKINTLKYRIRNRKWILIYLKQKHGLYKPHLRRNEVYPPQNNVRQQINPC